MLPQNIQARQVRTILYRLRRQFRSEIKIKETVVQSPNFQTGVVTKKVKSYTLRNQIALPQRNKQTFVYDLAYIASNKNFTQGGFFDKNIRTFIIDKTILPFELDTKYTVT